MKICKVNGCNNKALARGWCNDHYKRWAKYGDPLFTTHHHKSHTPVHNTWTGMKSRCYNAKQFGYKNYGGRGITVCDRWKKSFLAFYRDMGDPPEGAEIDRINNDGNYEPSNCQWVTRLENSRNKRTTKLTVDQVKEIRLFCPPFSQKQMAEHYNVNVTAIQKIVSYTTWSNI